MTRTGRSLDCDKGVNIIHPIGTRWIHIFLIVLQLIPTTTIAGDNRLPVKLEISLLIKSLTYENNLAERCPNGLNIGVVGLANSEQSKNMAKSIHEVLNKLSLMKAKIRGLKISSGIILLNDSKELIKTLIGHDYNIFYLSHGLEKLMPSICALAARVKILLITGEESIFNLGACVAVFKKEEKPKIFINLSAAKAQGARFDANFLYLVQVKR